MKLRVNTLLDFSNKYSLKNKLHTYNLLDQRILLHNALKRFPSLKHRLNEFKNQFKNHQVFITLHFDNYDFRDTYLKWIYNNFSNSISNRRQIHRNEIISLLKWAKHFNKNSRYLKFLTIKPEVNDNCLKAYLKVFGISPNNGNVSFKIKNAITTEYPKADHSSFYQFEKTAGNYLVNSIQNNFKRTVSGFPFTLVNDISINKIKSSLELNSHTVSASTNSKPNIYEASKSKLERPKSIRHSKLIRRRLSNLNSSKSSLPKEKDLSEQSEVLKSSMLLSKASSASSSLAKSISQSKAAQARSKSQNLISMSKEATNSIARSKAMNYYSAKVSLNYSYSNSQSRQVSLNKSGASLQISHIKQSLLSSSSESEAVQSSILSQLFSKTSVSVAQSDFSFDSYAQSIKPNSSVPNLNLQSSNRFVSQLPFSSQDLKLNDSLASSDNTSVSNSNVNFKSHIKWKIDKLHRPKIISFAVIVMIIVIIIALLFQLQEKGIIN